MQAGAHPRVGDPADAGLLRLRRRRRRAAGRRPRAGRRAPLHGQAVQTAAGPLHRGGMGPAAPGLPRRRRRGFRPAPAGAQGGGPGPGPEGRRVDRRQPAVAADAAGPDGRRAGRRIPRPRRDMGQQARRDADGKQCPVPDRERGGRLPAAAGRLHRDRPRRHRRARDRGHRLGRGRRRAAVLRQGPHGGGVADAAATGGPAAGAVAGALRPAPGPRSRRPARRPLALLLPQRQRESLAQPRQTRRPRPSGARSTA